MSEAVRIAIIGLAGVIAGVVISYVGIVKVQNTEMLKLNSQRVDQYKLAALEQRLKIHQETYTLAKKCLKQPRNVIKLKQIYDKLDKIYMGKSLYLDDESRKKLVVAMGSVRNAYEHPNNISNHKDNIMMNMMDNELIILCDALLNGVHLSPEARDSRLRGI